MKNYSHAAIRRLFSGKISHDVLVFETTYYCTKNCRGCYIPKEKRKEKTVIDEKFLLSTIKQAKKLGIRNYGFFGGEPLSEHAIPVSLMAADENPNLTFIYCTNGEYVAANDVSFFKNYPNIAFFLSIDGFEETNDNIRGKGSYSSIIEASKKLKHMRRAQSAFVTIRKENIDEVLSEDFLNHLLERGFNYIQWAKYENNANNGEEVPNEELHTKLKGFRDKTMKMPVFQNTDIMGEFFCLDPKKSQNKIYLSLDGDMRIEREDMSEIIGNLNEKTMEDILYNNLECS
ncbi:MAG: radical SAM protein [Candidatus Aenigmarchaeota archaeon]|nr:radical SAM protein [Candidatus Aenigmarchaeota archaeon]